MAEMELTSSVAKLSVAKCVLGRSIWSATSAALILAAGSKLLEFALFVRYLRAVSTIPSLLIVPLAIMIILAEVAIPMLSLNRSWFRVATTAGAGLFLVFSIFHGIRLVVGDPLPCSCFGRALVLSPLQFLMLDVLLAFGCVAVPRLIGLPRTTGWTTPSFRGPLMLWVLSGVLLLVLEGKTLLGAAQAPVHPLTAVSVDSHIFDAGQAWLHKVAAAKATVVVFGDYQCPYTRKLLESSDWATLLRSKVLSVQWRELPLTSIHARALSLACLSKRAVLQNQLLAWQPKLADEGARGKPTALSTDVFKSPDVGHLESMVDLDRGLARTMKLSATPLIFLVRGGQVLRATTLADILRHYQQ